MVVQDLIIQYKIINQAINKLKKLNDRHYCPLFFSSLFLLSSKSSKTRMIGKRFYRNRFTIIIKTKITNINRIEQQQQKNYKMNRPIYPALFHDDDVLRSMSYTSV